MKNKFVILLALSLFIMSAPAFGFPLDDEAEACWQKGVQAALRSKDFVPGKIYMKFERLDGDGKTTSQKETWLELPPGENQGKVLKVLEDGKDITREELQKERIKKEKAKGKKSAGDHSLNLSSEELVPLISNSKKPVASKYLGRHKDHGVDCFVYEFQKEHVQTNGTKKETVVQQGEIWLDAGSGMPVKSSYSISPLPSMVKQMEMNTTYVVGGDRFFVKSHAMSVQAGILFFKKRFRIGFILDGYREADKENQDE
ncbi:MAG: hypothetical protein NTW95_04220 [Candidatus Aminicenantes bacterium]|nr:hypothetical protein [Candidatus Aminicenantes bacterium]